MNRRWEFTIKTKLGLLTTTLINTVLFFALVTTAQDNILVEASTPTVVTDGLIVHLDASHRDSFDPGTSKSKWINLVGTNNEFTITNPVTNQSSFVDTSVEFDGSSTQIALGSILTAGSSYTKELWVRRTNATGARNLISAQRSPFWFDGNSLRVSQNFGSSPTSTISSGVSRLNEWIHVAATFNHISGSNNNVLSLYIDGKRVNQVTNVGSDYLEQDVFVGQYNNGNRFQGFISQVRIYDVALTDEEIRTNFVATLSRDKSIEFDASNFASYSGNGTVVSDLSGNNNHGTIQNGVVYSSDFGGYFDFRTTNSEITTTTQIASPGPQEFSIESWVRVPANGVGKIIGYETNQTGVNSGSYDRHLYVGSDGKLTFGVYPGTNHTLTSTGTSRTNQWIHVVATYSNSANTMRLFVNGVQQASRTDTTYAQQYAGYWRIGGYRLNSWLNASDGYFNGDIAEIRLYNSPINAIAVQELYENSKSRFESKTIAFDANTGTGTIASITSMFSGIVTLPSTGFNQDGFAFSGFNTQDDGNGVSYALGSSFQVPIEATTTLYATWTALPSFDRYASGIIRIDKTKVDEDLTNFPVTIVLNSGNFNFNLIQTSGADVFFTDTNDKLLPFEVDYLNVAEQRAVYHVLYSGVIQNNSNDQDILIRYGQVDGHFYDFSAGHAPTDVWDTNYVLVMHMGSTLRESTSNNNGTVTNNGASITTDDYGNAFSFDAASEYISVGTDGTRTGISNANFTISLFSIWNDRDGTNGLFGGNQSNGNNTHLEITSSTGNVRLRAGATGSVNDFTVPNLLQPGVPHYLTGRSDDRQFSLFAGPFANQLFLEENMNGLSTTVTVLGEALTIGNSLVSSSTGFRGFNGLIYEVRLSKVARSDAWLIAESFAVRGEFANPIYTVSFETNDGTNVASITGEAGSSISPVTTRSGYVFDGWFTNSALTTPAADPLVIPVGDATLYADWDVVSYSITYEDVFNADMSALPTSYTVESGASLTLPAITRTDYVFNGWFTNTDPANTTPITSFDPADAENKIFYARWTLDYSAPTITSGVISNVTTSGATVTFTVTSSGKDTITGGLSFATTQNPTSEGIVISPYETTTYTVVLSGLDSATTYFVRPYVTNRVATVYGEQTSFTTPPLIPTFTLLERSGLLAITITSTKEAATSYEFNLGDGWVPLTGTHPNYTVPALTNGETYNIQLRAVAGSGDAYSAETTALAATPYAVTYTFVNDKGEDIVMVFDPLADLTGLTLPVVTSPGYEFVEWMSGVNQVTATELISLKNNWSSQNNAFAFTADWALETYLITYSGLFNGTSGVNPASFTFESQTITLSSGVRTGYRFDGWYSDADLFTQVLSIPSNSVDDTVLYAKWIAVSVTVTFDNSGVESSTAFDFDSTFDTLPTPSRTGYSFTGWFTAPTGGEQVFDNTFLLTVDNFTLFARWVATTHSVSFDATGGTPTNPSAITVTFDQSYATLPTVTRDGYTFRNWLDESSNSVTNATIVQITADQTLTADWTANGYVISFDTQSGVDGTASGLVTFDAPMPSGFSAPSRSGYAFDGYFSAISGAGTKYYDSGMVSVQHWNVSDDTVLYASWIADTYVVTFDTSGISVSSGTLNVVFDHSYGALPTATRTGYTFAGWYTAPIDGTLITSETIVSQSTNHTLYAQWTPFTFTLTFDETLGGDLSMASTVVTYDQPYGALATTSRTGYTFAGWFTASAGGTEIVATDVVAITDNQTLYAQWTVNPYDIVFDANGGSGTIANQTMDYDSSGLLPINSFTRSGYTFTGWNTQATGDGTSFTDQASFTMNVTGILLYAQWSVNNYTITFDQQLGANGTASGLVTFDAAMPSGLTAPSRTGYTFDGYFTDVDGSGVQYYSSSMSSLRNWDIAQPTTLYASWIANEYIVTFNPNGGQTPTSTTMTVTFDQPYGTLPNVSQTGYSFTGWFTEIENGSQVDSGVKVVSTRSHELFAQWSENNYSITYVSNNGTLTNAINGYSFTSGTITLPTTISREYFVFDGWFTSSEFTGSAVSTFDSTDDEDKTFYAKFTPVEFNITYDYDVTPNTPTNPRLYRALTIPHEKIDADLTNFPLTVVLDETNFDFTGITYSGIYFTDANNVLLDFEVDSVSTSPNNVIYHVRIPFVSNSQDTVIKVYYSNEIDYSSGNNPDDVWDEYYIFVSHMGPGIPNSASSTEALQINNITFASGLLGDVANFDGGFIELPSSLNTNAFTKVLVIRPSIVPSVVNFATSANDAVFFTNEKNLRATHNNRFRPVSEIKQQLVADTRYFIANRFISNTSTIWLDDAFASAPFSGDDSRSTNRANIIIGAYNTNGANPFRGTMDEVRISNIGRSDAWIKAEYLTLTNDLIEYSVANPLSYNVTSETITLSDPKRIHYDFDGWFANADLVTSPVSTISSGANGDLELYAKWIETIYSISYGLNNGTLTNSISAYTYTSGTITLPTTITRFVHLFDGWYDNASFAGQSIDSFDASSGGNRTYYAKWTEDIVPPSVHLIGENEIVVEVGSSYSEAGITFSDNYSSNNDITITSGVTLNGSASSIDPSVVGEYILTYTLVDENNNEATISRTIRVVDTTPPVISDISNQTIDASDASGFVIPVSTNTDNSNLIQFSGTEFISASGQTLLDLTAVRVELRAGRNVTIVYTAVDPSDNTSSGTILITAIDNIQPVISGISSGIINASDAGTFTTPIPTITDNSETIASSGVTFFETSGMVELSGLAAVRQSLFDMHNVTIRYSATDDSNNTRVVDIEIKVTDDVLPVIEGIENQTINASEAGTFTTPIPTITDNSNLIQSSGTEFTSASGQTLPDLTAVRTELRAGRNVTIVYTAVDPSDNTSSGMILITANDNIKPVISGISSRSINASDADNFTTPIPTITDNSNLIQSSGTVFTSASGQTLSDLTAVRVELRAGRNVTIVYTADDPTGNTTSGMILITANDNIKPVISGISSRSINASDADNFTTPIPTITDNSETIASSGVTFFQTSGMVELSDLTAVRQSLFEMRNVTVVYTADDPTGNTTSGTILITAIDNIVPILSGISAIEVTTPGIDDFVFPVPVIIDNDPLTTEYSMRARIGSSEYSTDLETVKTALLNRSEVYLEYTVSDAAGNTVSKETLVSLINFIPVKNPDVIILQAEATANKPFTFTYPANPMIDLDLLDKDTIVYTTSGLPAGLVFDAATMTISGTPELVEDASIEEYSVALIATDTQGDSGLRTHIIRVYYGATLTFVSNGGSAIDAQSNIINQPLPSEPVPILRGYTFLGWFTNNELTNGFDFAGVMPETDLTLYAKWTPTVYTITYVGAGSTAGLPATYTVESSDITLSRPTRPGLIFSGWSSNGFIAQGSINNVTFTASWISRSFTLSIIADGRQLSRASLPFGENLSSFNLGMPPARVGYTTIGWNQELPNTMPASNLTITAVYAVRSYAFIALDDKGNELARSTVNFSAAVPYPSAPDKEGFTFVRWSTAPTTMPASDLSVSAVYEAADFDLNYVDREGNNLGSANVAFGAVIPLIEPPFKEGFVFVEWTGLPDTMPAAAVTVTAVYEEIVDEEFIASEEVTPERSDELTPQLPNRGVATPILIPTIVLPPNPEPVITRVRVNGSVVDVSIIPGQPVGELPQATLDGYLFQGWMNAITGEMITPETIIQNPDYIVFAPIFIQAPSMIDAARNVFQSLLVNPFTTLTKTNDLTTRTDNIHSSRSNANGQPTSIDLRGGLIAVINNNGSVTIALPNERIPITLSVRGLDAVTLQVYYSIGEAAPEFDAPTWLTYTGEPFLTSAQGQSVFMMVKDAYDTHQVSYLRPATFVANLERIPTISAIKADDMTLLTNTNEHSFLTTIEYEDSMVDMFVIEPSGATQLEQVIVRYRANTHNTSLLLNVEAMTWREEIVPVGSSLGVYLRSGDNLDFELEYRFTGQASITETFQIAYDGESIGVFLAVGPNGFLRVLLGVLILTAMIAPYVVNPKPKKNMSV